MSVTSDVLSATARVRPQAGVKLALFTCSQDFDVHKMLTLVYNAVDLFFYRGEVDQQLPNQHGEKYLS